MLPRWDWGQQHLSYNAAVTKGDTPLPLLTRATLLFLLATFANVHSCSFGHDHFFYCFLWIFWLPARFCTKNVLRMQQFCRCAGMGGGGYSNSHWDAPGITETHSFLFWHTTEKQDVACQNLATWINAIKLAFGHTCPLDESAGICLSLNLSPNLSLKFR